MKGLPPGHKEQDPILWVDAFLETVRNVLEQSHINPRAVQGIGISGQQHGLVPLDNAGKVIRPAKLWNDTSTIEECAYLTQIVGGDEAVIDLIGNIFTPGFTASKLLWLKRHEPENFRKLTTILLPHNFLNFYLTGQKVMEYGDASGTALMDIRSRTWCKQILEAIDPTLEEKLPPLQASDKPIGTIRQELAQSFGFREDVIVSAGSGDNMMAAIGTGNTQKGIITASLGTSGTIYAYSDTPIIDPKGEIAAFCDSTNAWLPLLCTMNVTVALDYVRALFNLGYDELTEAVNAAPVGAEGLLLLPYFEGERTPNIPNGTGIFYGLNIRTLKKSHLARSAMEGVTLGMNYGLNRMRELGINPQEIRLTGGGSQNPAWRQIAADIFDTDVVSLKIDESAAFGAALQALWCYLNERSETTRIQEITSRYVEIDEKTRISPNPSNVALYKELQELHDEVGTSLRSSFSRHREFVHRHTSILAHQD